MRYRITIERLCVVGVLAEGVAVVDEDVVKQIMCMEDHELGLAAWKAMNDEFEDDGDPDRVYSPVRPTTRKVARESVPLSVSTGSR